MQEIPIPSGVKVTLSEDKAELVISGKLGSSKRSLNTRLFSTAIEGNKIVLTEVKNKKLAKMSSLSAQALASELKNAMNGVENGIEKHMRILFAHFPMSIEIKGDLFMAKNVLGEKKPRIARIVGSTKVEVKGQEVMVKGVDQYDVGQTAANLHKLSFARGKDTRVFQDGIFYVTEE